MNRRSSRLTHLVVAVALVSGPGIARAQDTASASSPSPATAGWLAAGAFLVPIALVPITQNDGVLALAIGTTVLAPMLGYTYGGIPGRGLKPLALRGLTLGATIATVGILCSGNRCPILGSDEGNIGAAAAVALAGAGTIVVMTIVDIGRVPSAVRANNRARVAVSPAWIPSTRTVGLALKIGF
jgi:hypothetical protein